MLTGSQGAGIGIGGTFFILFLGLGIWYSIHRAQKKRLLKKTQPATSTPPTANVTTKATAADTYTVSPALEMGTAEGNTHELPAPRTLQEMGDLAPEYTERDSSPPDADEIRPKELHRDGHGNEKRREEKLGGASDPVAELEGDVAFDGKVPGAGGGEGEIVKDGVGKGFVLTE